MASANSWGVESGKLMYSGTFGHVPTCVGRVARDGTEEMEEKGK
jgi:hypothetical protein